MNPAADDQRQAESGVPHCYRHPDRETYLRCNRCDRYICPECSREASVGHQCPECVREGNATVRGPVTMAGAPARGGSPGRPLVTYVLVAINVLAYVAEIMSSRVVDDFAMLGVATDRFGFVVPGYGVADGEWYRLITAAFLHSEPDSSFGIAHIVFNMWALWVLGPQLEAVLGRWRFTVLYLLSALGGSVLLYLVDPAGAAVGASGAIFGLFGAFFVIAKRVGAPLGGIGFLLGFNLLLTFGVGGISWQGHIGGLVIGVVLALAYAYAPQARRTAVQIGASVAVAALLTVLVVIKTAQLSGVAGV